MEKAGLVASVERNRSGNLEEIKFTFSQATKGQTLAKNEFLIPLSPAQLEAWAQHVRQHNFRIGDAVIRADRHAKRIGWTYFYPFGTASFIDTPKRGIGTIIHHHVTEFLARNFRGYVVWHTTPGVGRQAHLRAMGIAPYTEYPINRYRKIVRRYLDKKFGKRS